MSLISRRDALVTATAGSIAAAATAHAQSGAVPMRPGEGGTDLGPRDLARARQNPDILVPPATDSGTLPNLRFSFSDSHVRQESGGWTRQVTDLSLNQWLALTPPELVQRHLDLDRQVVDALRKQKSPVVPA